MLSPSNKISEGFIGTTWQSDTVVSPLTNTLYLLTITAVTFASPTPSGLGLTWQLVKHTQASAAALNVWTYRAMKPSGLSSGKVSASWGGTNVTGSMILKSMFECSDSAGETCSPKSR